MHLPSHNPMKRWAIVVAFSLLPAPVSLWSTEGPAGAVPDLVVNSIEVTPSAWTLGETVTIVAGVLNNGSDNSGATTVDFFLSDDSSISSGDTLIGSDNVIPLLPTEFWAAELSEALQPDTGNYWIGACVKTDGLEQNTENNCSEGFEVTVTENSNECKDLPMSCGDALFTRLSSGDCDLGPGGRGHYAKTHTFVASSGTEVAIKSDWTGDGYLYLEDPSGVVVAENDDADDIFSSRIEFTLDSGGTWKIWTTTFDVQDTMNYELELQCEGGAAPDLIVAVQDVNPSAWEQGAFTDITVVVSNDGDAASTNTTVHYYLSANPTITVADELLGADAVAALEPGDSEFNSLTIDPQTGPGTYWIGACVEPDGNETSSGNNCSSGFEVTVQRGDVIPITAGLNDAWFNPDTVGQGFFFNVFPGLEQTFVGWFTFELDRPDASVIANIGEPGQRWMTTFGDHGETVAVLDIFQASGGVFNSGQPDVVQVEDGSFSVDFTDCSNGLVRFDIPSVKRQGEIPIQRISDDNVAFCEELAGIHQTGVLEDLSIEPVQLALGDSFTVSWQTDGASSCTPMYGIDDWDTEAIDAGGGTLELQAVDTGLHVFDLSCEGGGESVTKRRRVLVTDPEEEPLFPINEGLNDAWFNRDTAGQGFFINVFPGRQMMFLSWFTFDTERPGDNVEAELGDPGQRWFTALGEIEGNRASLNLYNSSGGLFNASPPEPLTADAGTIEVEFSDCNNATVDFRIESAELEGTVAITRVSLDNVSLCENLSQAGPVVR